MKRIISTIATIAMLVCMASCSKEENQSVNRNPGEKVEVTLTATFQTTKVNYTETGGGNLHPSWEIGDVILAKVEGEGGDQFTLTVKTVDGNTAILKGTAPRYAATVYLIYKHGATEWSEGLSVNYDGQSGDKTMPAVMFATGAIVDGGGDFEFHNAGSVLGVVNAKGLTTGQVIKQVIVKGDNLSAATVSVSGGNIQLTATQKPVDKITANVPSGITVGDDSKLSTPLSIAIPAGARISEVRLVTSDDKKYDYNLGGYKNVAANQYLYIKTSTFTEKEYYFTVDGAGTKVEFAPGNLYCRRNASGTYVYTFDFEPFQWANRSMSGNDNDRACTVYYGVFYGSTPGSEEDGYYTSGLFQWHPTDGGYGAFTKSNPPKTGGVDFRFIFYVGKGWFYVAGSHHQ